MDPETEKMKADVVWFVYLRVTQTPFPFSILYFCNKASALNVAFISQGLLMKHTKSLFFKLL